MGEFAVLEGSRAILMTLKHRLRVRLAPAEKFGVTSDRFGAYEEGQGEEPPHVALCRHVLSGFSNKVHVDIQSDIPVTYGFGSSAALVAALTKAVFKASDRPETFREMFEMGHRAILKVFGRGSGADLAAALSDIPFLVFDPLEKSVRPFDMPFVVQAIYTGYKTPTPQVLKEVREQVPEDEWKKITGEMKTCVDLFIEKPTLAGIRSYQKQMDALHVTCDKCQQALEIFYKQGVVAKISGSGRGDCVAGFAEEPANIDVPSSMTFLSVKDLQA